MSLYLLPKLINESMPSSVSKCVGRTKTWVEVSESDDQYWSFKKKSPKIIDFDDQCFVFWYLWVPYSQTPKIQSGSSWQQRAAVHLLGIIDFDLQPLEPEKGPQSRHLRWEFLGNFWANLWEIYEKSMRNLWAIWVIDLPRLPLTYPGNCRNTKGSKLEDVVVYLPYVHKSMSNHCQAQKIPISCIPEINFEISLLSEPCSNFQFHPKLQ